MIVCPKRKGGPPESRPIPKILSLQDNPDIAGNLEFRQARRYSKFKSLRWRAVARLALRWPRRWLH